MEKPLFRNSRTFDIQVATPSGAGRTVHPKEYVEGDYFISSYKNGCPLSPVNPTEAGKVDRNLIVLSISISPETGLPLSQEVQSNHIIYHAPVEAPISTLTPEEPKKTLSESITDAINSLPNTLPAKSEIDLMPTPELLKLAATMGIAGKMKRDALVEAVKGKLTS